MELIVAPPDRIKFVLIDDARRFVVEIVFAVNVDAPILDIVTLSVTRVETTNLFVKILTEDKVASLADPELIKLVEIEFAVRLEAASVETPSVEARIRFA